VASYWLEEPAQLLCSNELDRPPDVDIVGGGVTGCACALGLASRGARVRLHEARGVGTGASGRNGGFALRGGAMAYDVAVERFGRTSARAFWRLTEDGLRRMAELAGDAFRQSGSVRLAADETEAVELRREHDALASDGFAVEWQEDLPAGVRELFPAALVHPPDGALQPARWARRLAALAADAGAEIREHSRVTLADLRAERVVVATDGYGSGLLPVLDGWIRPARAQVLVTEPLPEQRFPRPHYARHGLDYWQQVPDGRLVVGGWRDAELETELTDEEATTPGIQRRIEALVRDLLGRSPRITHRWAGIFGITEDLLPLVGPLPGDERVWLAAGYSGHGNVLALVCGELVAEAIAEGQATALELFDPARLAGQSSSMPATSPSSSGADR
jgi:glycine/D-amino acid oxidase-like deaminating enzyme